MRKLYYNLILSFIVTFLLFITTPSVFAATPSFDYKHGFVGAKKCKKCHKSKKKGDQYGIWKDSRHAKSFKTLGGRNAKKYGKKFGIDDPQKSEKCLICHTTAFKAPKDLIGKKFKIKDGIQCERCHGPGKDYSKKKVMTKIMEEMKASNKKSSATAQKTGLVHPTEERCLECHVESMTIDGVKYTNPAYTKPFNFKESMEKIKHFRPENQ